MDNPGPSRPLPIALTVLVAFFSALAALAVSNGNAHAHGADTHESHAPAVTDKQVALRTNMRVLWEDHIVWTRLAIISLTTGSPDTEATVGRLLQNQIDIGDAVKPFYGDAAGDKLTAELRNHILIAAGLIAAAKAGDSVQLAEEQARWQQNADEIARVLNSVNPRFWKLPRLKAEMRMHLRLTTDEVVARLEGDWDSDVVAYDEIHRHILGMSDYLAAGIVAQFPKRFQQR